MKNTTKKGRNHVGIAQVSNADIMEMAATGVSDTGTNQTVAERSGSDDKVAAAEAENAPPRVSTFTPEARVWIEGNKVLNTEGLFGQRGLLPLPPEAFQRRAQFLGRPLVVVDMEEICPSTGDASAPATATCTTCGEQITSFVKIAMVTNEGDLKRNKDNSIVYRGQAVTTGRPLAVHAAHIGNCLYKLRNNLNKTKELPGGRKVADLLPSQTFEQANERLAGLLEYRSKIASEEQAKRNGMQQRLGATIGDAVRHNRTDDGIDRGSFAPKTLRGQSRKQRRWSDDE